jgi:hypothetical protein
MKFNWGHGILIFIIIFLVLSVIFIVFSLNQNHDLVEDDYYDQGAGYSNQIEINKRSYAFRDSITVAATDSAVKVTLCQSLVNSGDTLYVYFFRPSDKKSDYKVKFPMSETAIVPVSVLKRGRYLVKLSWVHHNEVYQVEKEISILSWK